MKSPHRVLCVMLTAALLPGAATLSAQSTDAANLPGGTWSSLAELPDFVDVWETSRGGPRVDPERLTQLTLTPAYAEMRAAYQADPPDDSTTANCVPPGMPGIMTQPYPIEFLFTPGKVTIVIEAYMQVRHIYTDGRPHPEDPDPTFMGHSIGHWEDDTLVIDTVGFTPDTPLSGGGVKHSEKMHIVERIRLVEPDLLEIEVTIDDPEALAEPWVRVNRYARHSDWTIAEYICQENNRNFVTPDGQAGIDLSSNE